MQIIKRLISPPRVFLVLCLIHVFWTTQTWTDLKITAAFVLYSVFLLVLGYRFDLVVYKYRFISFLSTWAYGNVLLMTRFGMTGNNVLEFFVGPILGVGFIGALFSLYETFTSSAD